MKWDWKKFGKKKLKKWRQVISGRVIKRDNIQIHFDGKHLVFKKEKRVMKLDPHRLFDYMSKMIDGRTKPYKYKCEVCGEIVTSYEFEGHPRPVVWSVCPKVKQWVRHRLYESV